MSALSHNLLELLYLNWNEEYKSTPNKGNVVSQTVVAPDKRWRWRPWRQPDASRCRCSP